MDGAAMPQWIEVALRTLCATAVLFVITKLLGKRQVTQLSVFEYITGITIGSLAAYISLDLESNWYLGLVAVVVWAMVAILFEFLTLKSKRIRDIIDGKGRVLIQGGKILEDNLKKERLTIDELLEELRTNNVFRVADVEFALMEPSGKVNVLLKKEHQPVTPKELGIRTAPEGPPQTVIMDGKIMDEPLATLGLSRGWLHAELEKLGVALENVFLGQVDAFGELYVDLYDDKIQAPEPQQKAALYALLKKCEADLEMFALSTQSESAKRMYGQCAQRMQTLLNELKPFLHG